MTKKTIAWIEDDADVIGPVMKPLEKAGFLVNVYSNYSVALQSATEILASDIIILDLILPAGKENISDGDLGIKLLTELYAKEKSMPPVIVFSVIASPLTLENLPKGFKIKILSKPIKPPDLRDAVYALLNLPPVKT